MTVISKMTRAELMSLYVTTRLIEKEISTQQDKLKKLFSNIEGIGSENLNIINYDKFGKLFGNIWMMLGRTLTND